MHRIVRLIGHLRVKIMFVSETVVCAPALRFEIDPLSFDFVIYSATKTRFELFTILCQQMHFNIS